MCWICTNSGEKMDKGEVKCDVCIWNSHLFVIIALRVRVLVLLAFSNFFSSFFLMHFVGVENFMWDYDDCQVVKSKYFLELVWKFWRWRKCWVKKTTIFHVFCCGFQIIENSNFFFWNSWNFWKKKLKSTNLRSSN